jgi:hypothetical protein
VRPHRLVKRRVVVILIAPTGKPEDDDENENGEKLDGNTEDLDKVHNRDDRARVCLPLAALEGT